jgi:dihydroorotate dehydrogenase
MLTMTDIPTLIFRGLRLLPPEAAHRATILALKWAPFTRAQPSFSADLRLKLWGLDFPNPIGIAAGLDKHAEAPAALLALGFGFVEIGSVTPRPQPGNPRPRVFRLAEDRAVINRYGFNSDGHAAVRARLEKFRRRRSGGIVGVNLGKNKDSEDAAADYSAGVRVFAGLADYLVINISSPNTAGLRALQQRDELRRLLERVVQTRAALATRPALLLKIAPELTREEIGDVAAALLEFGIDGAIATNTTLARSDSLRSRYARETGGLSGQPLFRRSTEVLAELARATAGRIPLVGVGGVESGADAYGKFRAGASLAQLYTGLVFAGPGLGPRLLAELRAHLKADGIASIVDAVGAGLGHGRADKSDRGEEVQCREKS